MSNSNGIIKCPHCFKVFFDAGKDECPFCGKCLYDFKDIFGDIFGNQNNPFQDFTNQGESDGLY